MAKIGCPCGKDDKHSLRDAGKCDGLRKYGANYKPRKRGKKAGDAK